MLFMASCYVLNLVAYIQAAYTHTHNQPLADLPPALITQDNTGRSAATPPVCERLRQQCTNSRECLLVMLKQRDAQLAAATAALAAAQANRGTEGGN